MTARTYHQSVRRQQRFRHLVLFVVITLVLAVTGGTMVMINTTPSTDPAGHQAGAVAASVSAAVAGVESQGGPDSVVAAFEDGVITDLEVVGNQWYDADTPFYIGSVSKMFTAALVARLVDSGRLQLDEPVVSYLPWFRADGASNQITVRHLLNQTSGLPTAAGMVDLATPDVSLEQRVRALSAVELVSDPGTTFHYCTKNFAALALVIEAVTGSTYAEVLTEELIEPLALAHTFVDPAAVERDVTPGHLAMFGAQLPASTPFFPAAIADGYLISSASDLAAFADVLVTGTHEGDRYLSPAALDQLRTAPSGVAPDPDYGSTYGFGLRLQQANDQQLLWHEGELPTAHADVGVLLESRAGLVVLSAQNGQLYSGDTPFLTAIDQLAGITAEEADDGGFRAIALGMVGLAAAAIAGMVTDALRWPALRRRPRGARLVRSAVPRAVMAAALCAGTFFGIGSMLGLEGAVPFPVLWAAAPDLTATVLTSAAYLGISAVVLALWPADSDGGRPTLGR